MALPPFDEIVPGLVRTYGAHAVTREAILAFAAEFDPQPFHLDEAVAEASLLGGLAASGWHVAGILMRLNADHLLAHLRSLGGPGVEEVRWLRPVRPGDVLSARVTVTATRRSSTKTTMGLLTLHCELVNQDAGVVMTQDNTIMVDAG